MLSRADWHGEWLIARRHPLLWIVAVAAIALIGLATNNEAPRTDRELFESLTRLSLFIPAFILPFLAGALAPVFYLREVEHGMGALFAAYPQTPRHWLAVRLGSFAALLIGICAVQHVVIVAILATDHPDKFGDLLLRAGALLLQVHIPACLIWACALARVSCATGKAGMVYLAAAFGWLAYIGLATLTGTPLIAGSFVAWEPLRAAMLLADPYAITALVSPPPLASLAHSREIFVIAGRVGWLAVCFLLVRAIAEIPALRPAPESAVVSQRWAALRLPQLAQRWDNPSYFALLLRWTMLDKFFLLALAGWAVLLFPEVFGGMHHAEPLSLLTPDSRDALNRVMWDMVPPMGTLLLLYAADRASRMASATGMEGLTAATPQPSWRFLVAQLACLWTVAFVVLAFTLLVVLVAQLAAQSSIQPREYIEQAGQLLPGLLLAATAFAALHGMIRSRMAANLIAFALFVLGHSNLAPAMGLLNPLWKPISVPLAMPDHVLGLGGNWAVLAPFALFWTAICAAAMVLAVVVHHRALPHRQVPLGQALRHPATLAAGVLLVGGIWQGIAINRLLAGDFALVSADERATRRAQYERRYADWLNRPQPHIATVRSDVDFADNGRSAKLRIAMQLINRSTTPIAHILVGRNLQDVTSEVAIDAAAPEIRDVATGQTVFRLDVPMLPGEYRTLRFTAEVARSALASTSGLLILRSQFASLPAFQILPLIGFQREFTLRDPARRAALGLPVLTVTQPSQLPEPGPASALNRHQTSFESIISTPQGMVGLAPGELLRSWTERGRSYFHYRTDRAIRNAPAFLAVPWESRQWQLGSLTAHIHAPGPVSADNANLLAMRDTLTWLHDAVAPYPGKSLRLIAAPEFGSGGFALPQLMLLSQRRAFRAHPAPDAGFNQIYRRAAHETAHQWFGHLLGYGIAEERAFLVESLAKYAELVMVERRYGTAAMQALVEWEADRLAWARLAPTEVATPLIDADETEDMYSRATLAFACLRSQLGDAAIVTALREIAARSQQTGRAMRSLDFVSALKRAGGTQGEAAIELLLNSSLPIEAAMERVTRCQPALAANAAD